MSNDSNQTNSNSGQNQKSVQEAQTVAERRPLREPVRQRVQEPVHTVDHPVDVRRPREKKDSNIGEYAKFSILAVFLCATPFVIYLLIPLIFGQIVPAVLGSNLPTDVPVTPGDQVVQPESGETPAGGLSTDPEVGIGGEATPVFVTPPALNATPDNVLVHIVRSGETLDIIAQQYGLTAAELATANNIENPNQIFSGQVLIIPQAGTP